MAAETPQVLAWISADADGDGKPDTLTLRGDATLLLEWAGRPPTVLRLGPQAVLSRPADLQFQATASGRYIVARATEVGRGGARQGRGMAVLLRGAQPTIVYQGPVGPVGRDGEYSQELGLVPAGLLRYQTNPAVRRCDGENRLFVERYSDPAGFAPSPESTLPAAPNPSDWPALTVSTTPPAEFAGPPVGIYRFTAASAAAHVTRADQLGPPRELEDDSPLSAWAPSTAQLRGAFVTAMADGTGHAPRAIRVTAARGQPLPTRLLLILGQAQRFQVELGAAPVQWLLLPASVAGDCLSLVVAAAPPNAAIGDVAIYSELDGPAGLAAIAAQVAGSEGSRGEGAARTLLLRARRDAAGRQAVLAAVTTALGSAANSRPDGLRRLDELLLQLAEAEAPTRDPLAAPPPTALDALLAQVVTRHVSGSSASDEEAAAFLASLVSYPRVGARLLQRISDDRSLRSSVRGQALAHWAGLVFATAPAEAATAVLSRLPEATTERGLAPGVHAALVTVASCTLPSEPALLAVLATLDAQLAAATAPGSANEPAALSGLTLVLSAVSGAQARCPDSPRTQKLADRIAQSWPPPPENPQAPLGTTAFLLRYRLLQALERLGQDTMAVHTVLTGAAALAGEPVLRQLASQLRVRLPRASADGERLHGLRDPDTGVRLATLAGLSLGEGQTGSALRRLSVAEMTMLEDTLQHDTWPRVRRAAVEARAAQCREAGGGVPPTRIEALRAALSDRDIEVQRRALGAIARCEDGMAVDVFVQVAENPEAKAGLRGQACALLARHALASSSLPGEQREKAHHAAAVALADLLRDPEADDRHAAALAQCLRGFAESGDLADLDVLIDTTSSEAPASLRQLALGAIASICSRRPTVAGRRDELPPKVLRRLKEVVTKALATDSDARMQESGRRVQQQCR